MINTVKKLKELCYGSIPGGGEIPQKALKEIRMTRDKPYEKLRNNVSHRGNSIVLKTQKERSLCVRTI